MGRRPAGTPPQMRRGMSKGYAYAHVYVDGRKITLGRWNSQEARQAYRRIVVEWERQHAEASQYRPSGPLVTVADLVAAFLDHARVYYRHEDGTATDEQRAFRTSLAPLLAKTYAGKCVDEVRPADVKAVVTRWISDGRERNYVNQMLGRVKRCFSWGVEEELVSETTAALVRSVRPLAKGRTLAPERDEVPPAPFPDLLLTFAWGMDERQQLITLIQLRTGARPGEVCRMRGDEVSRNELKVGKRTVVLPAGVWAWTPGRHKTKWRGKRVVYMIGPKLQRILTPYLAKVGDGFLFPGLLSRDSQGPDAYASRMKETCRRVGVEPWTPNQLRHFVLTRRDRQSGIEAASISVGHSSVDTTSVYVERDIGRAAELAAKWD